MTEQSSDWSIKEPYYRLFDQEARRLNRFTWELPDLGIVRAKPLSEKIAQLLSESRAYGTPARIVVTTRGGLKLMLEGQLTTSLLQKATRMPTLLEVPVKLYDEHLKVTIWSPERSRLQHEVVITDEADVWLRWA